MINWKKYVDHIYVITCTKYLNRIPDLYKELDRVDINVNSDFVTEIQNINTPLYDLLVNGFSSNNPDIKVSRGLFISTITHYYCMKNALENGYSKVLIFEDDVRFLRDKSQIKYILDESIKIFDNNIGQILCCCGSVATPYFNNCEDAGNNYNVPYLQIDFHKYIVRSSACNICNIKSMEYFCNMIESFKIEPVDGYEWIYDDSIQLYITTKHLCMQQDWIKYMYNTCKDYNMLYPTESELQEIRKSIPFGYRDGEEIYQSIIKYYEYNKT